MKRNISLLLFLCFAIALSAQNNTIDKIIFIPHPRSDDSENQSVQDGIEPINFSLYDMILLGGDLTYYTTTDYATLDYCDSLFDLGSPNTLWTFGNHDMSHPEYVPEYTGRPAFYAYNIQQITFAVLCTELDVNGFVSSYISGDQLQMIQNITDTITDSKYLVLLQHRLLWMIGNDSLETRLDSVGQSTAQLDTANFYEVVYPLLQQVKSKGIKIICLGGDRADINIEYSPEDSITYLASTMVPEFTDAQNHVIILTIDELTDSISWEFVPLEEVEKNPVDINDYPRMYASDSDVPEIFYDLLAAEINIQYSNCAARNIRVSLYESTGQKLYAENLKSTDGNFRIRWNKRGMFILLIEDEHSSCSKKIIVDYQGAM